MKQPSTPLMVSGPVWSRRLQPFTWIGTLLVVLVLIGDGLASLVHAADGYYAFSPGTAPVITSSAQCRSVGDGDLSLPTGQPCVRLSVPSNLAHGMDGALYMVDVYVGKANPLDFLLDKLHLLNEVHPGMQLFPKGDVLGTTPPSQLGCQDAQDMQDSTSTAAVVALRRLGYTVRENDLGAQLRQVQPGTPAATAGLQCGDVVTAIGTTPVHSADNMVNAIHAYQPGDKLQVTVNRTESKGGVHPLTVTAVVTGTPALPGQRAQPNRAFLGVVAQDDTTYTLPFGVSVQVGSIGGPSAGLALTLGLIDVLSNGQLTGGHRIAATGEIAPDGRVLPVGGVAQKTIAVRHAGAQVFLVPEGELKDALKNAGGMKVYAVSSLEQALGLIRQLGGHVPPLPGSHNGAGSYL